MDSSILQTIKEAGEIPVHELRREYSIDQFRPDKDFETGLDEVQHHLLEILKATGPEIFDDEAQWHTYQNVIAALTLADRELQDEGSRSIADHKIEKPAPGNYNPLGELDELDEPTIEQLADRYDASAVINEDWEDNPEMSLQQALGGAVLNLTMGRLPGQQSVERRLLAAMFCVDKYYAVETNLEVNTVTQSYTGFEGEEKEYETEEMTFSQRNASTDLFNDA